MAWLARKMHFGPSGRFTPAVSDGNSARVLCFMNLSGAYGGYVGTDEAFKDAQVMAAAKELLAAVKVCRDAEMCRRADLKPGSPASNYTEDRLTLIDAALAKAGVR